jgi:hypothetical protein
MIKRLPVQDMFPAQAKIKPDIIHNISPANLKPLPYFYRQFLKGPENKHQICNPENYSFNGIIFL